MPELLEAFMAATTGSSRREGDISWTDIHEHGFLSPAVTSFASTSLSIDARTKWLATTRARLGFVYWNTLWYATGGGAWTEVKYNGHGIFLNNFSDSVSFSQNKGGWVAGGGAEWMFNPNLLFRAEYLYYKFDGANGVAPYVPAFGGLQPAFTWGDYNIQVVRFGATYKF